MNLSHQEEMALRAINDAIRASGGLNLVSPSICMDYCELDYRMFAECAANLRRLSLVEMVSERGTCKLFLTRKGADHLKTI